MRTTAPAPFRPGKNHPRNVAPDALRNSTARPLKSVGRLPMLLRAGAIRVVPAAHKMTSARTNGVETPTATASLFLDLFKRPPRRRARPSDLRPAARVRPGAFV